MSTTLIIDGKERCGARKDDGRRCRKYAGAGTGHKGVGPCANHTGSTPAQELNGAIQLARRDMAKWAAPLAINPYDALLQLIAIAAGEVAYAVERVSQLQETDLVGNVVTTVERPRSFGKDGESADETVTETTKGPPAENIWRRLQHEAMDRLAAYIRLAGSLDIAERRLKLAELEGQLLVDAIRGILIDLGVIDRPETPGIVRKHLARVSARRLQLAA